MKIIGHIYTDFPTKFGIPRQSSLISGLVGKIVMEPEFRTPDAFAGIEEFSHLWLLWKFSANQKQHWSAKVAPPRLGGRKKVGVFATRSPFRPNDIGLSCVKLLKVVYDKDEGTVLYVDGVDMMDKTPVYDIKPYIPITDSHPDANEGYTKETKKHRLTVVFDEALLTLLPKEKRSVAIEILAQDPRPAFYHFPDRKYGVEFAGFDIRFTVCEDVLTVCEVEPLENG